jgi:hypothetical protein
MRLFQLEARKLNHTNRQLSFQWNAVNTWLSTSLLCYRSVSGPLDIQTPPRRSPLFKMIICMNDFLLDDK